MFHVKQTNQEFLSKSETLNLNSRYSLRNDRDITRYVNAINIVYIRFIQKPKKA